MKKTLITLLLLFAVQFGFAQNDTLKKVVIGENGLKKYQGIELNDTLRVACIGNSITAGSRLENPAHDAYPAVLQRLLGSHYNVKNFGISARTLLNKGDHPYMKEEIYKQALAFCPHIVTIKLGTNDSKAKNWQYNSEFKQDLKTLIQSFQALPTHPDIYLCLPIPCAAYSGNSINDSTIVAGVIPYIKEVAIEMEIPVIDLHTAFEPFTNLLPDKVHPNIDGAEIIAHEIAKTIKHSKYYINDIESKKMK